MTRRRGLTQDAPNNGLHPTADTAAVIYPQRLGAAGDAGRSAASPVISSDAAVTHCGTQPIGDR